MKPAPHVQIMMRLEDKGFQAYLVGGCVRDVLLQRQPKDFDVTTDATPDQVRAIFQHTIPVGAKFGVVVVVVDEVQVEVATFRADGAYTDGRRPDEVTYSKFAKEDVIRRDFTMNGLLCIGEADTSAYASSLAKADRYVTVGGKTYGVIDYVQGYADIERGIIRAIGNAHARFAEDALRMLRAVRFAAQLGFEIEEQTKAAIEANAHLLKAISRERIAAELFKMLSAPFPLKGLVPFISTGLFRYALPPEFPNYINMVRTFQRFGQFTANKDAILGMAMFFADTEAFFDQKLAGFLKLSNETKDELLYSNTNVQSFGKHVSGEYPMSEASLKRMLRSPGVPLAIEIMTQDELIGKTNFGFEALMTFLLKVKAYTPEQIKPKPLISGKDLLDLGIPAGPIFTNILYDVESFQLNGVFTTKLEALGFVGAKVFKDDTDKWIYLGLSPMENREMDNG